LLIKRVQKDYIRKQLNWDLFAFRLVLKAYEYIFDLPLSWSAEYTERHLRQEVDFLMEARNSERALAEIQQEPLLCQKVHVPKVYWDCTTSRVLTTEWIEGVSLTDARGLKEGRFGSKEIMQCLVETFAFQIFKTGFVHCDPHPGNIIIRRNPLTKAMELVLLDHGK
jgi:aarF domain-containing kinase